MGIKSNTDFDKLFDQVGKNLEMISQKAVQAMIMAGINTVAAARSLNTYTDWTGNLRSSIGCVVYDKGVKRYENFESHGASESGDTGVSNARELAEKVAEQYGEQIVTVLVAGMDYAVYVESKGFDVLTGPWQNFSSLFEQYYNA